jgi:hypothetical protein
LVVHECEGRPSRFRLSAAPRTRRATAKSPSEAVAMHRAPAVCPRKRHTVAGESLARPPAREAPDPVSTRVETTRASPPASPSTRREARLPAWWLA